MRGSGCASTKSRRASASSSDPGRAAGGRSRASSPRRERARDLRSSKGFAATCSLTCGSAPTARRGRPPARSLVVPMAAAGGGDRRQHRRRLPAVQQVVQLFVFGGRPLGSEEAMRRTLIEGLLNGPLTERRRRRRPRTGWRWPQEVERAAAPASAAASPIRQVDAGSCNGCELEIHALGNPYYDLERFGLRSSPRRATPTRCWSPGR